MEIYDHFYDKQIKRFLLQLVRGFSGFQYMTGRRGTTPPQLKVVPCVLAKRNRQAAAIQHNASENTLNAVPIITVDHQQLRPAPERLQNPGHVGFVTAHERKRDPVTGELTDERGNSIKVERLMPRPFNMDVQIDIWTSNMDQKHQLMEQILTVIFPTFDIQNSDNPIDWSALTTVQVKDVSWTSASFPIGSDNEIEVATITLEIPIWLNPPAKILRSKVIEKVITNINEADFAEDGSLIQGDTVSTVTVTPGNHHIKVSGDSVQLLGSAANEVDADGNVFTWDNLEDEYGREFIPTVTQIRVKHAPEDEHEIIGLYQGTTGNTLSWQLVLGSLPSNTMTAVNAVIDPRRSFPDGDLPSAADGQRYLIIADLPPNTDMWGAVGANSGAIIQRINGEWTVVFSGSEDIQYVVNLSTGKQLRWDGVQWSTALDGIYSPSTWRIV